MGIEVYLVVELDQVHVEEMVMVQYFSLITDVGIAGFCWIFVVTIGGGVIDNDINDGIVGFCCVCIRSLRPFDSSIVYSVCDTYRPKFEGEKGIKLNMLNIRFLIKYKFKNIK